MVTSQSATVPDNPATSILEINSIPIPLLKRIPQKTIKKTSLHVWDREEFELQTELFLTVFNVIFHFILAL